MGLDTIELVMAIEDRFGIAIPEAEAEKLQIVGDLSDYVVAALKRHDDQVDEDEVWERIVQIMVEQLGVRPEEVTRTTDIVYDLGAD